MVQLERSASGLLNIFAPLPENSFEKELRYKLASSS